MAPIRRYLRITAHSILEVRIYLEDPYQHPWLLTSTPPVLPRIMQSVRPHVIRQLREERERALQPKSKRKKGVKDVAVEEDFEVSVFLTEGGTRHSLLVKQKGFSDKTRMRGVKRRRGKAGKLVGWLEGSKERPVELGLDGHGGEDEDEGEGEDDVVVRRESEDEDEGGGKTLEEYQDIGDDEGFVRTQRRNADIEAQQEDEKKKMALDLSYDGFAIYGKVLCLVVKRRGSGAKRKGGMGGSGSASTLEATEGSGRAMMETWVSTQAEAMAEGVGRADD